MPRPSLSGLLPLLLLSVACSAGGNGALSQSQTGDAGPDGNANGAAGGNAGAAGSVQLAVGGSNGGSVGTGGAPGPWKLPDGFKATEFGGFKLGDPFNGDQPPAGVGVGGSSAQDGCGTTILGVVRDFKGYDVGGHPDFQHYDSFGTMRGLVEATLGADSKPVYAGICDSAGFPNPPCSFGQEMTDKASFDQWYRFADGINKPYVLYLALQPNNGILSFQADQFFPVDGAGWNAGTGGQNFSFTTEVHTEFRYEGGEVFTFIGDDDVWVFINKQLAVDLGGIHARDTGTADLDQLAPTLGLEKGKDYPLDLFQAERHTSESHFRIDTDLAFTNCGIIVPEPPIH